MTFMTASSRILTVFSLALGVATASLAPTFSAPVQAAVPKVRGIAVVDMQKVLNDTKQGVTARKKLEDSSKAKQEKLDGKRKKLEADQAFSPEHAQSSLRVSPSWLRSAVAVRQANGRRADPDLRIRRRIP